MKSFSDIKKGKNDGIKIKCRCESKSSPVPFIRDGKSSCVTNFAFFDGKDFMNSSCYDSKIVEKINVGKTYTYSGKNICCFQ